MKSRASMQKGFSYTVLVLVLTSALGICGLVIEHKAEGGPLSLYKRSAPDEHGHDQEEVDDHGHDQEEVDDHGHTDSETCAVTEHSLAHEFNELAEELLIMGPDSVICSVEDEDDHDEDHNEDHEGETEEEETHTNSTYCNNIYNFVSLLLVRLNLTTDCCLENGDMCDEKGIGASPIRTDVAKAYGYGFLMVVLISFCSLIGLFFVPFVSKGSKFGIYYKYIYALMIALGASALFCDAILHLIPESLGLHDHAPPEEGHAHEEQDRSFIWKGCVLIGGTYVFLLFEIILHSWNSNYQHDTPLLGSEDHDSAPEEDEKNIAKMGNYSPKRIESVYNDNENQSLDINNLFSGETGKVEETNGPIESICLEPTVPHGQCKDTSNDNVAAILHPIPEGHPTQHEKVSVKSNRNCFQKVRFFLRNIKPLAWLIIFGDAIHNFADGLALGAAISQSLSLGLSTMIAIVFHELPHEMGDFIILLSSGMKWYTALTFNFLSALTAVVGFFVGVAISTQSAVANTWILSIAAGVFLYIALVDLVPELIHSKEKGCSRWGQLLMANIGFMISFAALLLLAIYEENLNSLITEV